MTEFKQIIGRGTRINEAFGKRFFTIMDFRNVTTHFADPDFDGEPIRIKELREEDEIEALDDEPDQDKREEITVDNEVPEIIEAGEVVSERREKYYVNGVNVTVLNERIQYLDGDGKLMTGSLKDYTKQKVREQYQSLDQFLNRWQQADKKQAIIAELTEQGIVLENLKEAVNSEMDLFDLICHAAFDQPPLTRAERAKRVKKRDYFSKYSEQAGKVLEALLDKYADEGIENIENMSVLQLQPLDKLGSPMEIIKLFGGKKHYLKALVGLENEIYRTA